MILLLAAALFCGLLDDARELEVSGRLWEAGAAYEQAGSTSGECRVMCALLEEALYAGHSGRAHMLLCDLERIAGSDSLRGEFDYWYARLAWAAGLDSMAIAGLESVQGEPWLIHRARGTALLYRGLPGEAASEFTDALDCASTVRRSYYAALDLSFALLSAGREDEAMAQALFLARTFPCEGLPRIQEALCSWNSGGSSRSAILLDSLSNSPGASIAVRDMARRLLEDLE